MHIEEMRFISALDENNTVKFLTFRFVYVHEDASSRVAFDVDKAFLLKDALHKQGRAGVTACDEPPSTEPCCQRIRGPEQTDEAHLPEKFGQSLHLV
jgi:hypothetical protein